MSAPIIRLRAALLVCALAGCGGSSGTPGTSPPPPPPPPPLPPPVASATVEVRNNFFTPESVVLMAGGQVTWSWTGSGHSVTSVLTPGFTPSAPVSNAPFTHGPIVFSAPGTYQYICTVHGAVANGQTTGMRGEVIVQ